MREASFFYLCSSFVSIPKMKITVWNDERRETQMRKEMKDNRKVSSLAAVCSRDLECFVEDRSARKPHLEMGNDIMFFQDANEGNKGERGRQSIIPSLICIVHRQVFP